MPTAAVPTSTTAGDALPDHRSFADLGAALIAVIPADARVVGFGELHARTDRASIRSSLARFTQALPAIADRLSDLVIETWLVDPACGKTAVQTTTKVETMVKRPEATKSEIAVLADAARAARIQPHAMTLACADYATIAPRGGEVDPIALLSLTTRELNRIATSAVVLRWRTCYHHHHHHHYWRSRRSCSRCCNHRYSGSYCDNDMLGRPQRLPLSCVPVPVLCI